MPPAETYPEAIGVTFALILDAPMGAPRERLI
jgi:hypothetical protein